MPPAAAPETLALFRTGNCGLSAGESRRAAEKAHAGTGETPHWAANCFGEFSFAAGGCTSVAARDIVVCMCLDENLSNCRFKEEGITHVSRNWNHAPLICPTERQKRQNRDMSCLSRLRNPSEIDLFFFRNVFIYQ